MTDNGWRPAETARYGVPVIVRQSDGEAHVARKLPGVMGRADIWSRSPYPPVRVTGWRPIEPEPAPSAAEVEEMCARLAAAEAYVRKYTPLLAGRDGSLFADAAAMIRALAGVKEKTDG